MHLYINAHNMSECICMLMYKLGTGLGVGVRRGVGGDGGVTVCMHDTNARAHTQTYKIQRYIYTDIHACMYIFLYS